VLSFLINFTKVLEFQCDITAAHNIQHKQHQKYDNEHMMRMKEVHEYLKQQNA
jgi:hypothetical protein